MRHLTLEALARLVDEAPTTDEAKHLEGCEACRAELDALRRQTEALATLPKLAPGPDAWPELRTRLRREGLVRSRRPGPVARRWAAGIALFVAGGTAGFMARGQVTPPEPPPIATTASAPDATPTPAPGTASRADLTGEVERTEEMFAAALDRFMRANGTAPPDPAARLAALDNIVLTTAEALNESPADPVINSYHLTAVAQRDELLRQLATSTAEPVF